MLVADSHNVGLNLLPEELDDRAELIMGSPRPLAMIFACYLMSGVFILLFNKVLRIRASGHSCGTTGPIAYLIYLIGAPALIGLPFLGMVYWASLRMKRHTFSELVLGGGIAVVAAVLGAAIFMP